MMMSTLCWADSGLGAYGQSILAFLRMLHQFRKLVKCFLA